MLKLAKERNKHTSDLTEMAKKRTGLSEKRTSLASERNELAAGRTNLSSYRSLLARGRTELAFIRTGLAFVTIGIGLMRYFGLGYWTILDVSLAVIGAAATIIGSKSFITTVKYKRRFDRKLKDFLLIESETGMDRSRAV